MNPRIMYASILLSIITIISVINAISISIVRQLRLNNCCKNDAPRFV